MKLVSINTVLTGSTGNIMRNICGKAESDGFSTWTATSYRKRKLMSCVLRRNDIVIGNYFSLYSHLLLGKVTGLKGLFSFFATLKLIRKLNKIQPDIIHLHNLHDGYINFLLLFHYIKKNDVKVIWTLHDCWSFTGRCPYFDLMKCDRWKFGCHNCPYPKKSYPKSSVDASRIMWKIKQRCFTDVKNMTLVTPSMWLAGLVKQSFLRNYPVKIINNGIDLSIFKPTESDFRNHYGLVDQKLVLGVAFGWNVRKGLDVLVELSKRLPEDYRVVLVGTDNGVDALLPANIISIHRTQNQKELAEIYTAANVFANPTREEVFGMVNAESLACGTPVVTFKTGGSPECVDETCGSVVPCDDIDAMEKEIRRICEEKPYSKEACVIHSKKFDMNARFQEYLDLFNELVNLK